MRTMTRWALTPFAVLALAGCGDKAEKTGAETPTANAPATAPSRTLAATLQADGANGALARLMTNSGLDAALAGVGPYTLFAPAESAFKSQAGADVTDPAMKAEGAALLRAHIVPGALTRADIAAAVDRSAGQGAQMRTMAGGLLTFMRNGEDLVITGPDGATARLTGKESLATNGVLQPVDALLVKPNAAPD